MDLKNILLTKTVSVWGCGYLGYTTMLKLQNSGFNIIVYDFNRDQLKKFSSAGYPDKEQAAVWSSTGYLPKLNYEKIEIAKDARELFEYAHLHIVAIPEQHRTAAKESMVARLADIFSDNMKRKTLAPLIIFEPTFIPGHIEKYFIKRLKKNNLICSRDYYLGMMFRTDWAVEVFMTQRGKMPIAGCCKESLEAMRWLADYLGISVVELGSIREAELYVNAMNAIQSMASDFLRQLALGYPSVNMKRISETLFKNIIFDDCALNIGTGGERMIFAVDNLIRGSDNPGSLTLLKEFQDISISSVLTYAEYIVKHNYKSVTILGVTYKGNQKDAVLSPSITLADYLVKNSITVMLNDPFYTKEEIPRLVKGARWAKFPEGVFSTDVLVLASDHNEYKYLSQAYLDSIKMKTKFIIDNGGIWSHLKFGNSVKYHQVGDGTLNLSK